MYDYDDYLWELQDQAISDLIEQGIKDQRDENIASYLGTYGDAVQERINRCLTEARNLADSGYSSQAVISAVTAAELTLRYYVLLPILHGAFLSEEWSSILAGRILTQRSSSDRELLPAVLRAWEIDLNSIRLPDDSPFWSKFVAEIIPLRNDIVHKGTHATEQQGLNAVTYAETLLEKVVTPLSNRFGFSWSETRQWNPTQQGKGGAGSSRHFTCKNPFEPQE